MRTALLALPLLLLASACESGPKERTVRAQFACDDGRTLRAIFNLDAKTAELRLSRKETALLASENPAGGRAYAGNGYEVRGVGDRVTLTTPGAAPTACVETR